MSPAEPPGQSRARVAGIGLLGVSGVALVLGVVSLFTGGSSPEAAPTAAPPTGSAQSTASTQSTTEVGSSAPPESSTAPAGGESSSAAQPPASTGTSTPSDQGQQPGGTPTGAQPPGGVAQPGDQAVTVRVYNNSTISGLAARAAEELRANGWQVDDVGNYSQGKIATTTVYYRPGTDEEAQAQRLGERFRVRVEPRFEGIESASPGVILIVTNDYQGPKTNK
ncbi:LytR C-terminal domain-containing protein [Goodfellowiella coeruleoviolacea]|uniref:LytR cell envelope-related transcriptional attenuator n=1 Tax=Goodfellowiella coeruleoviolacea TaxID=334858 RepID=A0AAE3KJY0_9PSEU|nr:LytR C-terminal domain-containing protein [Goodfellowiella coeruleoviolacea]MCP2164828.1 LytR cell envelope-related transcriptional attenuator [Goodfellowiella coeruleoviolacea]